MKENKKTQITAGAHTDVGNLRASNEDSFYISEDENLIIVCDGMGGQIAGGLASKIAVETVKDVYLNVEQDKLDKLFPDLEGSLTGTARRLVAAVRLANRRIFKTAVKFPKLRGMGTTVAAITFDSNLATMVHVGDSRILRLSDNKILQLTEDHSWLNELIADDEIDEEDIETFSKKNVITRALGSSPAIKIDIHCEKYKKDDMYILATDGMHNAIPQEEIKKLIYKNKNGILQKVAKFLIETAKAIDGSDNITVALAKVTKDSSNKAVVGTSKTIFEEDDKTRARENKFIVERYGEPQMAWGRFQISARTPQRLFFASLVIFFLTLGIYFTQVRSFSNPKTPPVETKQNESPRKNKINNVAASTPPARRTKIPQLVIQRSKVNENAVMAFIFFNSKEDFENAKLRQRGTLLNTFQPYLRKDEAASEDLSIFLFDESGNVVQKSNFQLPEIQDD
ncbi:serine/threonine-protein phosphatase [candidate division KSB1 bacterium]|nr:serine/threonine-protein phosphatase [candidate division KSB1 bacterium]